MEKCFGYKVRSLCEYIEIYSVDEEEEEEDNPSLYSVWLVKKRRKNLSLNLLYILRIVRCHMPCFLISSTKGKFGACARGLELLRFEK